MDRTVFKETQELQAAFDEFNLTGKVIETIGTIGDLEYVDHDGMINLYNNLVAYKDGRIKRIWEPIYEDELPLDLETTTHFTTRGPIAIVFTDESALEVTALDFGVFEVRMRNAADISFNPHVNVAHMLQPILGDVINDVEATEIPKGHQERYYVDEAAVHPPRYIKLNCSAYSFEVSYIGCSMHKLGDAWPVPITLRVRKEAIDYLSSLFDVRS